MPASRPNLFTRDDTMFGVCQGIGEDFGFNPDYLRVALPLLLFLYPVPTIVGYVVAGVVVFAVRWLVPDRSPVEAAESVRLEAVAANAALHDEPLPLAA